MIEHTVILAGGIGTRLRPVTLEIPKPLVPVQGKAILSWQMRWFARAGVKRVTIIIPTKWQEQFEDWRQRIDMPSLEIQFWVETEPMGTLGALVHEIMLQDGPIFVTNGDELKGLDLKVLSAFHAERKTERALYAATVALIEVSNPSDYGVAEMREKYIASFHEKPTHPPSNFVSSGLYVVEPESIKTLKNENRFLMFEKEYFPARAEEGRLGGCPLQGPWFDCGTMERWERAIREWKEPE